MLFSKNQTPRCCYCRHAAALGSEKILCIKKGITTPDCSCPKFRYDPLKRIPPRHASPDFSRLKDDDFIL